MEKNVAEYLVYLKNNASELRKLGKEWGMTEKEIDECVNEALKGADNQEKLKNSPKNKARTCWSYFRVFMKSLVAFAVVLICFFFALYLLMVYHEPTNALVVKTIMHYSYSVMRMVRLAAVPLHGVFNMTHLYTEECLVNNPFFEEAPPDCKLCSSFTTVKDRNTSNFTAVKFNAYANLMKPVKLVNTLEQNVTYKDLREMYLGVNGELQKEHHEFVSSEPAIESLDALFSYDREGFVNSSDSLKVHWITRTVKSSAALRKLFPRPSFIPAEHEVSLEKVILIDGPNSTTHKLPEVRTGHIQLFVMGSGERRALVRPVDGCKENCKSMLVFMEPGDTLMYNTDMWRVYLGTNGDDPMIGYLLQIQV